VAQHECQCNDTNAAVVAVVTATAAATMATTVSEAVAKIMVATAMVGGIDNNQLKVSAEELAAVAVVAATETAMATEMVAVTAMKMTPTPSHQLCLLKVAAINCASLS
jgi:hypothetical protein